MGRFKKRPLRVVFFFLASALCLFCGFKAVLPVDGGLLSLPWTLAGLVSAELAARSVSGSLSRLYWGFSRSSGRNKYLGSHKNAD